MFFSPATVCRFLIQNATLLFGLGLWLVPPYLQAADAVSGEQPANGNEIREQVPTPPVIRLNALQHPESWKTGTAEDGLPKLREAGGYLCAEVSVMKDIITRLELKETVPIPAWCNNLLLRCTNAGTDFTFHLDAVVQDAVGREFYLFSKSFYSFQQGLVVSHNQRRSTEYWHEFPALRVLSPETYESADGKGYLKPSPPFRLLGFRVRGQSARANTPPLALYLRDVVLSGLTPHNSVGYYTIADQECFRELAPTPSFNAGQAFSNKTGKTLALSWEVFQDYAGAPILCGGMAWNYSQAWPSRDNLPAMDARIADLAKEIEVPVKEAGTYWIRLRTRQSRDGGEIPDEINEKEFRLSLASSESGARNPSSVPADHFAPYSYLRIAPARPALLFSCDEEVIVPVAARKPSGLSQAWNTRVVVRNALGTILADQTDKSPKWDANDRFTTTVRIPQASAGTYEMTAMLYDGERLYDRVTRMLGKEGVPPSIVATNLAIPATVPNWKQALASPDPLLFLCPIPSNGAEIRNDPQKAWEQHYKPFLDEAKDLSNLIELQVLWSDIERLPGIYDWSATDRILDYAARNGYRVSLTPEFRSEGMPEWVQTACENGPDGRLYGAQMYLFHRTRPNFLLAPEVREPLLRFMSQMIRRYRSHPAVFSYFLCVEHPGDTPRTGWFEGYSEENRKQFVASCQRRFASIEALNRAWDVSLRDFSELHNPRPEDPLLYKLGWLEFRLEVIEGFLRDYVMVVRKEDPQRLILMYTSGLRDSTWFRNQGCMVADGGSHDNNSILQSRTWGLEGFHHRTEDHRPGQWTAYFPSQIESSLFNIASGGGHTAHCKAYVRTGKRSVREQLADESKDLGKLKKLWPVWQELHRAYAYPAEAWVYGDPTSALILADSTNVGGGYGSVWATQNVQRAQIAAGLLRTPQPPTTAKLVMMLGEELKNLPHATMDAMRNYVREGGTLLMTAGTGRRTVGAPSDDWSFLRGFSFAAPDDSAMRRGKIQALTLRNSVFPEADKNFALREAWRSPYTPDGHGDRLAAFSDDPASCAVSWKPYGTGKVIVVWADTIVPEGSPFLRDIARWAGVTLRTATDQPDFWMDLQHTHDDRIFYGMVRSKPVSTKGRVSWLTLPEGQYQVTALVTGRELGTLSAQQLQTGIELSLPEGGAEFFRLLRIDPMSSGTTSQ